MRTGNPRVRTTTATMSPRRLRSSRCFVTTRSHVGNRDATRRPIVVPGPPEADVDPSGSEDRSINAVEPVMSLLPNGWSQTRTSPPAKL